MEVNSIIYPLIFIIVGLIAGGVLKHLLKKTPFPYTVGLFLFGLIVGFMVRFGWFDSFEMAKISIEKVSNADPDLILYLFLPVLIFDAAYELDAHMFRKNFINSSLLAGPGLVIAMLLTAGLMILLHRHFGLYSDWNWTYALMFGALISATDPVAVVSLLKELNTSKRFTTLVDAESMLNDGTGIVLFMLFFGAYTSSGPVTSPFVDFIFVVFGGAFLGAFVAFLCLSFITKVHGDTMIQNSVIIVSAYLVFLLAQSYLNVSGVIALVFFGLAISYYGRLALKPRVNSFMNEFWELAAHLGNTLIFIIVGVVIALKTDFTLNSFLLLGCLYIGLNLIRWVMILMLYPLLKRFGYGFSMRESVVLSWGGLRGALGLTLALMVSYATGIPEEVRQQILFLTGGIVTLTLLINATTIGWLLRILGLREESKARLLLKYSVNKQLKDEIETYYNDLKNRKNLEGTDWEIVKTYLPQDEATAVNTDTVKDVDFISDIRVRCVRQEKLYCWELFNEGIIGSRSLRRLTSTADDVYDADGHLPLSEQGLLFEKLKKPTKLLGFPAPDWYRKLLDRYFPGKTMRRYDLTRGFILMQQAGLKLLEEYDSHNTFNASEKEALKSIAQEIKWNMEEADKFMIRLESRHPVNFKRAITARTVRMLVNKRKRIVDKYAHDGLITLSEAENMIDELDEMKFKY